MVMEEGNYISYYAHMLAGSLGIFGNIIFTTFDIHPFIPLNTLHYYCDRDFYTRNATFAIAR